MSYVSEIQLIFSAILQQYFNDCLVIITNESISSQNTAHIFNFNSLSTDNISMYLFNDASYFNSINPRDRCLNYIILHSNVLNTFEDLEMFMHNDSYSRYNTRKYLILTHVSEEVNIIFDSFFVRSIPNFVVAMINIKNEELNCVEFYYQSHLGSKISLVDKWFYKDGTLTQQTGVNLYPEKIANGGNGTIFRLAPGYMIPYTDPYTETGVYWEFVKMYAQRFNLTTYSSHKRILIPDMFEMLDNGSVDIAFCRYNINIMFYFDVVVYFQPYYPFVLICMFLLILLRLL